MSDLPANSGRPQKPPAPLMLKLGYGLWAISLVWWFFYYAQYHGAFGLFGLKLACITGATDECLFFQQQLAATSMVPTYLPIFWYAGMVAMIVGLYQNYQAKKGVSR